MPCSPATKYYLNSTLLVVGGCGLVAGGRGTEALVLLEDTLLVAGGRGTEATVLLIFTLHLKRL